MAIPAYIDFHDDQGCKIEGDCRIRGREGAVEAVSLDHMVSIPVDAHSGELTGTRKHDSISFSKKIDQSSPYLYRACCKGQTFKTVAIRLYEITDNGSEQEYFRVELEDAKITAIAPNIANVKDPAFERYPHLEEVW